MCLEEKLRSTILSLDADFADVMENKMFLAVIRYGEKMGIKVSFSLEIIFLSLLLMLAELKFFLWVTGTSCKLKNL